MKRITIYFVMFVSFGYTANGQILRQELDSLTSLSYQVLKGRMKECSGDTICLSRYINAYIKKARTEYDSLQIAKGYRFFVKIRGEKNYNDSIIKLAKKTNDKALLYELSLSYYSKAGYYYDRREFNFALTNYLKAKDIQNNPDVNFNIALIKARFGYYEEALKIFLETKNQLEMSENFDDYLVVLYAISDAYRHLNKVDSAFYYNNLGEKISKDHNAAYLLPYFKLNFAAINYQLENNQTAYDSIIKVLPIFKSNGDLSNLTMCYYFMGMSSYKMNLKKEAVESLVKLDSLTMILDDIEPDFRNAYEILINYYSHKGDTENELKYVKRLLSIDKTLNKRYANITERLIKEYDTPKLLKDKNNLIQTLKKSERNYITYLILCLVVIILLISAIFIKRKRDRKRFEYFVKEYNEKNHRIKNQNISKKQQFLNIKQEIIDMILESLNDFEKKRLFLDSGITIQNMATDFNTNANYLSRIINYHKGNNFPNYLSDLRIHYCMNRIKTDPLFSKYTIKAIAEECGFNSAESFSKAFEKRSGIKPSYFIKEYNKLSRNS